MRLGLIVNPLAGIGGRVGLKGSDGAEVVGRALLLGAEPTAPARAVEALRAIASAERGTRAAGELQLFTYPGEMGERAAREAGFDPVVVGRLAPGRTTAADTRRAAWDLATLGVDLLLFVGGDGTARDVLEAIGPAVPVLGIPAGVKIHSSVYAISPARAAELVRQHLLGRARVREMEVMDVDEDLFRSGRVSARLYGYLRVPFERRLLQGAKALSPTGGEDLSGIAARVAEDILGEIRESARESARDAAPGDSEDETRYVLGPGSTMKAIGDALGIDKTTLGVDVVRRERGAGRLDAAARLVAKDASEAEILRSIEGRPARIVVTAIGGQGFIFGRGNQQISPRVIGQVLGRVGRAGIVVVATQAKLLALDGPLLVDTGDAECDTALCGHVRVITGYGTISVWKVSS